MSEQDFILFCIKVSPKDKSRKSLPGRPAEDLVTRNKTAAAALSSMNFCKEKKKKKKTVKLAKETL